MEHDTAGDPMTGLKWTHKTTQKIADELDRLSIVVSAKTVGRLLKDMKFSLRVNRKTIESGIKNPPTPKDRDRQFRYIKQMGYFRISRLHYNIRIVAKSRPHEVSGVLL
jgi:hypothetical protein